MYLKIYFDTSVAHAFPAEETSTVCLANASGQFLEEETSTAFRRSATLWGHSTARFLVEETFVLMQLCKGIQLSNFWRKRRQLLDLQMLHWKGIQLLDLWWKRCQLIALLTCARANALPFRACVDSNAVTNVLNATSFNCAISDGRDVNSFICNANSVKA